jgi:hypothetical protein
LLRKDGSVSVTFPGVCTVEIIESSAENFKMRFNDFRSLATNILIFKGPFCVKVSDAPEKMQFELIELQCDSVLRSIFNREALIKLMFLYQYLGSLSYVISTKFDKRI